MTTLMLDTAPFVRMLLPKIDAAHRRLLRAIDDFAEARMRRAVPQSRPLAALRRKAGRTIDGLRNRAKGVFQAYRPELHYMRGPGPRWSAKHDKA